MAITMIAAITVAAMNLSATVNRWPLLRSPGRLSSILRSQGSQDRRGKRRTTQGYPSASLSKRVPGPREALRREDTASPLERHDVRRLGRGASSQLVRRGTLSGCLLSCR
jgi:hypothetical protein